jgi:hypothetical protein
MFSHTGLLLLRHKDQAGKCFGRNERHEDTLSTARGGGKSFFLHRVAEVIDTGRKLTVAAAGRQFFLSNSKVSIGLTPSAFGFQLNLVVLTVCKGRDYDQNDRKKRGNERVEESRLPGCKGGPP